MYYVKRVEIAAPAEHVWTVLADVERWPSWTPTISTLEVLEVLDGDGLALRTGARVRIRQPRMAPAVYTVTDLDEGRAFRWEVRRAGLRQVAEHRVEAVDGASSAATLAFTIEGLLGSLMSPLVGSTVRRMVDIEAGALRERVEGTQAGRGW